MGGHAYQQIRYFPRRHFLPLIFPVNGKRSVEIGVVLLYRGIEDRQEIFQALGVIEVGIGKTWDAKSQVVGLQILHNRVNNGFESGRCRRG